jgi:Rrf2 family protein
MNLSKRSEYGLRALLDLATLPDGTLVPLHAVAERNNLPPRFLEQIFLSLRNAGIVRSQIGPQGGYALSRPAAEITFGEIIRLLDGRLAPVACLSQIAYEPCSCPDETACMLRSAMDTVRTSLLAVVDSMTLADAVRHHKRSPTR